MSCLECPGCWGPCEPDSCEKRDCPCKPKARNVSQGYAYRHEGIVYVVTRPNPNADNWITMSLSTGQYRQFTTEELAALQPAGYIHL